MNSVGGKMGKGEIWGRVKFIPGACVHNSRDEPM